MTQYGFAVPVKENLDWLFKFCPSPKDIKAGAKDIRMWPRVQDDPEILAEAKKMVDTHNKEMEEAINTDLGVYEDKKEEAQPAYDVESFPKESGPPPAPPTGEILQTWERSDKGRSCFLCTKGGGPSWGQVIKREAFDMKHR